MSRRTSTTASPEPVDVIVVGARVAGAATAMLLARRGLRVRVVDRAAPGSDTLSTHALLRAGTLQLDRWGLLGRVVAAGTPAIRRTGFHYEHDSVEVTIRPAFGVDALYAPRRTVLDPILVDAARAAGADVRFGETVTGVLRDAVGRVGGVVGRDARGRRVEHRATVTVGADGIGSRVARAVRAPVERSGTGASAVVYGYWSGVETEGYDWYYRPGVTAGLIPTNGGQTCVFLGTTPERFRAEIAPDVRGGVTRLLRRAAPDLSARLDPGRAPDRWRTFPGRPGFLRRAWGPGWALVGDAGYFKDPLSTHGMTDALRDAELLARALVDAAAGRVPEAIALAGYQRRRDVLSVRLFAAVDAIARYGWDDATIRSLLKETNAATADETELLAALHEGDAAADRASTPVPGAPAAPTTRSRVPVRSGRPHDRSTHAGR